MKFSKLLLISTVLLFLYWNKITVKINDLEAQQVRLEIIRIYDQIFMCPD